jgi:hypothetical protein
MGSVLHAPVARAIGTFGCCGAVVPKTHWQPHGMTDERELLIRRRGEVLIGTPDSALRRGLARGEIVRVTAGVYAPSVEWARLDSIARHRVRVRAVAERTSQERVYSHFAAAALLGIRILGQWPTTVDVTISRANGGRSSGDIRRHCVALPAEDVMMHDGHLVTTPARTVVDLARQLPFADAVVAMDSALHRRRRPAPLLAHEQLLEAVASVQGQRGWRRAAAAADFATPLADSPAESESRVLIQQLGFPRPVLQQRFQLDGRTAEVDFYWEDFEHVGECDGRAKYEDPRFLAGRTPAQVLIEEKARENEIRRQVRMFSRWEPRELRQPRRLWERLTRDGLPSTGPRFERFAGFGGRS